MAGYIGSKASVVSSGAERKKTFAITTSTTSLTGLAYTVNQVHVFHNGIRLVDGTDYTATDGTTITLTNAAADGDEVVVVSYAAFQTSDTVSASAGGTFSNAVTVTGNLNTTNVLPSTDNASDLGSTAKRFQDLHLSGGVSFDEDPSLVTGSVTAKTLDDYEEGTWTPVFEGTSSNPTISYNSQTQGHYTKIGQVVIARGTCYAASASGGSGSLAVGGLPFSIEVGTYSGRSGGVTISQADTFDTNDHPTAGAGTINTNYFLLRQITTTSGTITLTTSALQNTSLVRFQFVYTTNA